MRIRFLNWIEVLFLLMVLLPLAAILLPYGLYLTRQMPTTPPAQPAKATAFYSPH